MAIDFGGVSVVRALTSTFHQHVSCPRAVLPKKTDSAAWTALAKGFEAKAGFPNCGAAVDGVLIPIYYLTETDPHLYFSRKGFYALNWQVVVDSRGRFMYIGGGLPGTVYDGHCLDATSFGRRLDLGEILPDGFYVILDGGYVVSDVYFLAIDATL